MILNRFMVGGLLLTAFVGFREIWSMEDVQKPASHQKVTAARTQDDVSREVRSCLISFKECFLEERFEPFLPKSLRPLLESKDWEDEILSLAFPQQEWEDLQIAFNHVGTFVRQQYPETPFIIFPRDRAVGAFFEEIIRDNQERARQKSEASCVSA